MCSASIRNDQCVSSIRAIQPSQCRSSGCGAYHTETPPSGRDRGGKDLEHLAARRVRIASVSWRPIVGHGWSKVTIMPFLKNSPAHAAGMHAWSVVGHAGIRGYDGG